MALSSGQPKVFTLQQYGKVYKDGEKETKLTIGYIT